MAPRLLGARCSSKSVFDPTDWNNEQGKKRPPVKLVGVGESSSVVIIMRVERRRRRGAGSGIITGGRGTVLLACQRSFFRVRWSVGAAAAAATNQQRAPPTAAGHHLR